MAISKQRLEELIKQGATIYYNGLNGVQSTYLNTETCHIITMSDVDLLQDVDDFTELKYLYTTREESEFVARNHISKINRFEPPYLLEEWKPYKFCTYPYGVIYLEYQKPMYAVYLYGTSSLYKVFKTYQEALDYARKLFKEEV